MPSRNSLTRVVPQCAAVFGLVTGSATTPTVTQLTGDLIADQGNVSITRTSTGIYVISITNFRGQRASGTTRLNAIATPTTTSNMVACTSAAYTANTDTAVFTFSVEDDASSQQDNGFYFQVYAF